MLKYIIVCFGLLFPLNSYAKFLDTDKHDVYRLYVSVCYKGEIKQSFGIMINSFDNFVDVLNDERFRKNCGVNLGIFGLNEFSKSQITSPIITYSKDASMIYDVFPSKETCYVATKEVIEKFETEKAQIDLQDVTIITSCVLEPFETINKKDSELLYESYRLGGRLDI